MTGCVRKILLQNDAGSVKGFFVRFSNNYVLIKDEKRVKLSFFCTEYAENSDRMRMAWKLLLYRV